jgi:hypothetical protein
MTQNFGYQGCQPIKKIIGSVEQNYLLSSNYPKVGKTFSIWDMPLKMRGKKQKKQKFTRSSRLGQNIKTRLMQKFVNAYMFIFIALHNKND